MPSTTEKFVRKVLRGHDRFYNWACGVHPHRRPWHYQWLSVKDIYSDLREVLPTMDGPLVDVGCMAKPYKTWLRRVDKHVGIDVAPGSAVDHVVRDGEPFPLPTGSFRSALCTQVLQVTTDPSHLLDEMSRVVVPDGTIVVATPSCYNDMSFRDGAQLYKDYWRHTYYGVERLVAPRFEVVAIKRQGGIGSTAGVMMLNWIRLQCSRRTITELVFVMLTPLWIPFCLCVNMCGWLLDRIDNTGAFYHNVLVVMRNASPR
jgi:SAM-dependent methyltransferase